jgi:hypothetical protein
MPPLLGKVEEDLCFKGLMKEEGSVDPTCMEIM